MKKFNHLWKNKQFRIAFSITVLAYLLMWICEFSPQHGLSYVLLRISSYTCFGWFMGKTFNFIIKENETER